MKDLERKYHCQRNLVTIGFNLLIWALEVVAGFALFIPMDISYKAPITFIMYVALSSGIAPILYIIGMSDVRDSMERYRITNTMKIRSFCTRRNQVAPE